MQRTLVWLNLYGCEAVRHKLKNGLKTQKRHFLAVSDLMSDSLRTILVEQFPPKFHGLVLGLVRLIDAKTAFLVFLALI